MTDDKERFAMTETTLKPCPFCGNDDISYDKSRGTAYCTECMAGAANMRAMLVEDWNRRADMKTDATPYSIQQ